MGAGLALCLSGLFALGFIALGLRALVRLAVLGVLLLITVISAIWCAFVRCLRFACHTI